MSVFAGRVDTAYGRRATLEDGEMERWVLATLFASGSEPRDVYINVLFVTRREWAPKRTYSARHWCGANLAHLLAT
jgi:hypothetical protein